MTNSKVWGLCNWCVLFIFTAMLNTDSNRFDGGEGVEIKSQILDVLIFLCLLGIQMEFESGTQGTAWGWSKDLG